MRHACQLGKLKSGNCATTFTFKRAVILIGFEKFISTASCNTVLPQSQGGEQQHLQKAIPVSKKYKGCVSRCQDRSQSLVRSKFVSMYSFIQFITTPTVDTPGTALYLHFDNKRYIIGNLHEGLQRAALQTGTKIFKARDFFLTGKTEWRSNGGLLGVILTLADSANTAAASKEENERQKLECRRAREEEQAQGSPRKRGKNARERSIAHTPKAPIAVEDPTVTLHGGPNLTHTVATARSFVFRQGIPIKVNEFDGERETSGKAQDWEPSWEDERIQVWKMPILPAKPDDSFQQTSPKKRSLGEYMDGEDSKLIIDDHQRSAKSTASNDSEEHDQQTRKFVVSEMFSSSWRYDKLVPTPLYEVLKPGNLFIRDPATKKIVKYKGPMPDGTTPVPNVEVLVREPWPGATIDRLPPTKPSLLSMSYIIKIHKQRGKFKPEVAKALKVPPGPLWSALASGSEVQSSDDKTITPDMVLEPPKGGAGIAVIELPSTDYVRDLIDRPEWDVQKIMSGVSGIIWILGAGVSNDITLRDFIQKKSALEHIISSPDHCPNYLVHTSAAAAAVRHNCIDPSRFPIPVHSNAVSSPSDVQVHSAVKILSAQRGLKIDLHPSFGISSKDVVPKFDSTAVVQEIPESVVKLAQSARLAIEDSSLHPEVADQRLPSSDAEIICLGTGSAVPSPYRNVSGTLLRVPGHGSYLLDCGENTLGQMRRIFTEAELKEVLRSLKLIWISHLHADHHLGTAAVIKAWYEEVHGKDPGTRPKATLGEYASDPARFIEEGRRLFVVAHHKMMRWLAEYSTVEDFGYDQLVTATSSPNAGRSNINQTILDWNGLNVGFASCQDPKM